MKGIRDDEEKEESFGTVCNWNAYACGRIVLVYVQCDGEHLFRLPLYGIPAWRRIDCGAFYRRNYLAVSECGFYWGKASDGSRDCSDSGVDYFESAVCVPRGKPVRVSGDADSDFWRRRPCGTGAVPMAEG